MAYKIGIGECKMSKENIIAVKKNKLPFWFGPAWASRAVSLAINVVVIAQISFYCTDMLGMGPLLVGNLLLLSKLFDGVTDLIVGFIIDKTNTRFGKARPYETFIVLTWLLTILMFSVPDMGEMAQAVFVFIMYTLVNSVCATFLNGADAVYLGRAVPDNDNQVKVMSVNGIVVMAGSIIVSVIFPQLMAGIGAEKSGWTVMIAMIAVPAAVIGMLRFFLIKEVVTEKSAAPADGESGAEADQKAGVENKLSLMDTIKAVAKNKYIFIVGAAMLLSTFISTLGTTSGTYYFKYIMGDVGMMSLVAMVSMVTPFFLIFYPVLARKLGNTNMFRFGAALAVAGFALRTVGGANMTTIIIGSLLGGLGAMPLSLMINVYLIECMDYGEWKTGVRVEGMLASVSSFAGKIGTAVASSAVGIIMGMAGYDGTLEVQSAAANNAIIGVYNVLPLVLSVVLLVLAVMYNLGNKISQIREELAANKAA